MKYQAMALFIALSLSACGEATGSKATVSEATVSKATVSTLTTTTTTTTTNAPTTTTTPQHECSAAGLTATEAAAELPDAVVAARTAVLEAALACDFAELGRLAANSPYGFSYSFGEGGDPKSYWMSAKSSASDLPATLVAVLNMSYGQTETQFQTDVYTPIYFWPAAFGDDATDEAWSELSGLYTPEELEQMKQFGGYVGWRTGFTADGDWVFFIAGD